MAKRSFSLVLWHEQSDTLFRAISGMSPTGTTNGNFYSNSQGIAIVTCNGCIKRGGDIDTNMVRAGVVSHPSMWPFCGYNEIREPRRKTILIDYEKLQGLIGAESYDRLRTSHEGWVKEYLGEGTKERQDEWTASIAVGGRSFIEKVRTILGFRAKGRDILEGDEGYQLREGAASYKGLFGVEKLDIGHENTFPWDVKVE